MQEYADYKYFLVSSPAEYVAHVEINRPQKLNAFFEAMWHELARIFDKLSHDPAVRVVVLSGAGDRAFTAGLDVQATNLDANMSGSDGARSATTMRRHVDEFQECITRVEKCEKRECFGMDPPRPSPHLLTLLARSRHRRPARHLVRVGYRHVGVRRCSCLLQRNALFC